MKGRIEGQHGGYLPPYIDTVIPTQQILTWDSMYLAAYSGLNPIYIRTAGSSWSMTSNETIDISDWASIIIDADANSSAYYGQSLQIHLVRASDLAVVFSTSPGDIFDARSEHSFNINTLTGEHYVRITASASSYGSEPQTINFTVYSIKALKPKIYIP